MVTYDNIVKDITEITNVLGQYATVFYDLKKHWKGKSYDNLALKAENFRSANITKLNDALRHLSNAASQYNNYLKHKKDFQTAKNNYNTTDDSNNDRSIYRDQMTNASARMREAENYIKTELSKAKEIKVENTSSMNYGSRV